MFRERSCGFGHPKTDGFHSRSRDRPVGNVISHQMLLYIGTFPTLTVTYPLEMTPKNDYDFESCQYTFVPSPSKDCEGRNGIP